MQVHDKGWGKHSCLLLQSMNKDRSWNSLKMVLTVCYKLWVSLEVCPSFKLRDKSGDILWGVFFCKKKPPKMYLRSKSF